MSYLNYFLTLFQTEEQSNVASEVTFGFSVRHYFIDAFYSKISAHGSKIGHTGVVFNASASVIFHSLGQCHKVPLGSRFSITHGGFQKNVVEIIEARSCIVFSFGFDFIIQFFAISYCSIVTNLTFNVIIL